MLHFNLIFGCFDQSYFLVLQLTILNHVHYMTYLHVKMDLALTMKLVFYEIKLPHFPRQRL